MELLIHSFQLDWPVLTPILFCSVLVIAVTINRFSFYAQNKRNCEKYLDDLGDSLAQNNMEAAKTCAIRMGGVEGGMAEEAIRIFTDQRTNFSRSFDIASTLAVRRLESHLSILGTIGGVCPFLGLFGTVVRILYTFQDLATQGNQSAAVAMGIGSALIATAFGLGVAIVAVVLYNYFQSVVKRYEDDFNLIKLMFLNFIDSNEETTIQSSTNIAL